MKGFIEVTDIDGRQHLINVRHIEEVIDDTIYIAFQGNNNFEQDAVECQEDYEKIKAKIEEATVNTFIKQGVGTLEMVAF